jgi:hypothetical protein
VVFGKPYAATPPPPPPPPVDPHAECKAALAAMTKERDALVAKIARAQEDLR